MTEIIKIPNERVGVIKGEKNGTKKILEMKCNVTLNIDEEGTIEIIGDASDTFFAKDVIKAIGRGFSPNEALKLITHDYNLQLINLKEEIGSENAITRLKGRVIGEKGKIKSEIEASTECTLSIYGSTIGIIGKIDSIGYAHEAIGMLLDGAPHTTVINYLSKAKRKILESRLRS